MPDYTIPNLKNACLILEELSRLDQSRSIAEIADMLELPRTTVLRILYTLEQEGFVKKQGKNFGLGATLIALGSRALSKFSIREMASSHLRTITEYTNETSQLVTLTADKALILDVFASPHPLSAHSKPGTLADVHCSASGKAILAFASAEIQKDILHGLTLNKRTEKTIMTRKGLTSELKRVFDQGYAIDEEEYHEGVRCLAAPVLGSAGIATYALGITASCKRFTKNKIEEYADVVMRQAKALSEALGA